MNSGAQFVNAHDKLGVANGVPHSSQVNFTFHLLFHFYSTAHVFMGERGKHGIGGNFEAIFLVSIICFTCRSVDTSSLPEEWSDIPLISFNLKDLCLKDCGL